MTGFREEACLSLFYAVSGRFVYVDNLKADNFN